MSFHLLSIPCRQVIAFFLLHFHFRVIFCLISVFLFLMPSILHVVVPSKFYGFSEILRASEIFGDVIRFLLNSCLISEHTMESEIYPPMFSTNLSHSNAAVSLVGDRITVPFLWKSTGLRKEIELRGMVSCRLSNDLVVSITLHYDPFSVIRQSTPSICDTTTKIDEGYHASPFSF